MTKKKGRTPEQRIADLEARIAELQRQVRDERKFSPEAVLADRERLELSRADYAKLVGVASLTIYHWELGHSKPRSEQIRKWLSVKAMGKRKAWAQLGY